MIKNRVILGVIILVFLLIANPAQAFTAKSLDITVLDSTDATITFAYDLSWYENIAVFSRIADPGNELAKALKSQFNRDVTVTSVSGNSVQLQVPRFASRQEKEGSVMVSTPALSFRSAEAALNRYWFARFINPDFSPEVTRITFPDGSVELFYNQDSIPAIHHVISRAG